MTQWLRVGLVFCVSLFSAVVLLAASQPSGAVSVVLPEGNPQAGRQAFVDLKCTVGWKGMPGCVRRWPRARGRI
jgi:hypothetical protein